MTLTSFLLNSISNFSYQVNILLKTVCICLASIPLIYLSARSSFRFYVSTSLWTPCSSCVAKVPMAKFLSSNWYTTEANKYVAYLCPEDCGTGRWLEFQALAVAWTKAGTEKCRTGMEAENLFNLMKHMWSKLLLFFQKRFF